MSWTQTYGRSWTRNSSVPPKTRPIPNLLWGSTPTILCFAGVGEMVLGGMKGGSCLGDSIIHQPSIWFLGISFNKPALTHEPGAGAGLKRGPLPRETGAGTSLSCAWAISAPSHRGGGDPGDC